MDKGNKLHAVSEPKSDPPKHEKDQPLSRKLETSGRLQGKPEKKKPQLVKRKSANEVKNVKVILQASTGGEKQLKSSLHTKAIKTKKHVKFTANIEHHDQKLRALRVRVICRKFAYKWIRFTYGRIRPSVARSHHYNKLLASCMKQWKEFWWTSCKEWKLIVRADYHSRRYWKNWCATYKTTVSNYHLNLIALHHWAEVLLKRYLKERRRKERLKLLSDSLYCEQLLRKSIKIWYSRLHRRLDIKSRFDRISAIGCTILKRRFFILWKLYIARKHRKCDLHSKAWTHYEIHITKLTFDALRLYAVKKRLHRYRTIEADDFQAFKLQEKYWNKWILRCEQSDDLKRYASYKLARNQYRNRIKRQTWNHWRQYVSWKRTRKQQYVKAEAFFILKALPRYFQRLKLYVEIRRIKFERQVEAIRLNNEILQAKMFYKWLTLYHLNQDVKVMLESAICHHQQHMLTTVFNKWKRTAYEAKDLHAKYDLALSIRNHKALKQTFQHWRNSKNMLLARKHRMELAIKRYRLRCISKCWKGWIKYTLERKRKYKEYFKANHHYSVALLSKTMDEWKSYNVLWGEINTKVADLAASKRILLLRDGFKQWRVAIRTIKELKAIETECNKIYHKNLLRKVLSNWYNYLSERTIEKQMQRTKLEEARIQLKASKLARIFSHWRISKNEIVKMRQKMEIVVNYDNRKCLRNAFMKWNKYVKLCFRKEVMVRQQIVHYTITIYFKYFSLWKKQYNQSIYQKEATALSLWQWTLMLQKKAFKAWLGYTKYKKDKAARFSKATEMRKQYLLKTGIVAWLRIGDEIAQQKKLAVSKRESESLYRIYHVVYKFARHWMFVTFSKQPTVRNLSAIPVPPLLIEDEGTSSNEKLEVTESFPSLQYLRDKQVKRRRPRIPDYLHSEYSNASNETAAVRLAAVKNRKVARIPSHLGKNEALVRTLDEIDANILPRKTPQPLIKEIPVPVHDYLDPVELKTDRDQLSHKISDSSSYQYVNKDGAKNKGLPRAINPVKLKTDRNQLSRKKSDSSSYQFIDEGAENKNLHYEINPTEQKTYGNRLSQKTLDSSLYQFINKEGAENKSLQWEILQIKDELQDFERLKLEYNCCIESRRDILNRLEQETNDDRVIDLDGRLKQINMLLDTQKAKLECNRPRIQQLLSHIRTLLRQHSTS
ncbi:Protein SFI1-like protein [Trichoplax sp. H2]|nr:Protein SFI1-like protein [Trichoplax sp. H2]|eukprot:RDD40558.1 Protein SFI1-like protein [Trichoplax sp. H2]